MNLANQRTVVQTANQVVISIRSAELQYFNNFFSTFGVQSMVLAGIICGTISQTPGLDTPTRCNYFWVFLYFVSSAASVVATLHVLLCSVFINVFGQGIALRGPLGSMVKAVDGMVLEQQQILFSFILGIVFFTLQEVGMFFIVMDQPFAITCSLIVVAGMGITYHYTLRIYNRFNWNASIDHWQSGECGPQDQDPAQRVDLLRTGSNNNKGKEKDKGQREKQQEAELSPVRQLGAGLSPLHSSSPNPNAEVFFGAYLTLKVDDRRDRWQRHFFVLSGTSLLFYKDRQTHREKPSQPLNLRPIELGDFSLLAGAREPPFLISLLPHSDQHLGKAAWKFRCDTRSEFDDWLQALSAALALLTSPADDPHGTTSRDELVQLSSQHLSQLSQLETIPEEGERLSQW